MNADSVPAGSLELNRCSRGETIQQKIPAKLYWDFSVGGKYLNYRRPYLGEI